MRVALAARRCTPGDVAQNLATVLREVDDHDGWGVDLIVFGEAFLHGFDAATGDPEHDRALALSVDAPELATIRRAARRTGTAVCVGFLESDEGTLHSSALVVGRDGETLAHYRRLSPGWRAPSWDPDVYRDGIAPATFELADKRCTIALCGDLFTMPERFAVLESQVVLWPLHRDLDAAGWAGGELAAYARQANRVYASTLLVNDVSGDSVGGAAWLRNGKVKAAEGFDGIPTTLVVDLR